LNSKFKFRGGDKSGVSALDRISRALAAEAEIKSDTSKTLCRAHALSGDWLVRLAALEAADSLLSARQKAAVDQAIGRDECPFIRMLAK